MTSIPRNLGMARITRPAPDKEIRAIQKKFDVARSGRLFIHVPGADLDLVASDSDKVEAEVFVKSQSKNEALALTDRIKLRMRSVDKQTVRIESRSFYQNGFVGWNTEDAIQLRLLIRLPRSFNVDIQATGSQVSIEGVDGNTSVQLAGGILRVGTLRGQLDLQCNGCSVHVDQFSGSRFKLYAASSQLEVANVEARQLTIEAAGCTSTLSSIHGQASLAFYSGEVSVRDIEGSVEAQVLGCEASIHLLKFDDARFHVCGGVVDLLLPHALKARVLLEGYQVSLDEAFNFSGDVEEDRIDGRLNKGTSFLHAHVAAGSVRCLPVETRK